VQRIHLSLLDAGFSTNSGNLSKRAFLILVRWRIVRCHRQFTLVTMCLNTS
jgi:hypothetical protein